MSADTGANKNEVDEEPSASAAAAEKTETEDNWWENEQSEYAANTTRGPIMSPSKPDISTTLSHQDSMVVPPRSSSFQAANSNSASPYLGATAADEPPPEVDLKAREYSVVASMTQRSMTGDAEMSFDDIQLNIDEDDDDDEERGEKGVDRWVGSDIKRDHVRRLSSVDRRTSSVRAPAETVFDSVSHAITTLKTVGSHVSQLLLCKGDLGTEVAGYLADVMEKVTNCTDILEGELNSRDTRTDVEALLDFQKLYWNFQNDKVDNFRARAARVAHNMFEFKKWHLPTFLGHSPLPNHGVVFATVRPPGEGGTRQHTKFAIKRGDTVHAFVEKAKAKFIKSGLTVTNVPHVLKAKGHQEYMDPRDMKAVVMDHEYVRDCIRNQKDVELNLIPAPTPIKVTDEERKGAFDYRLLVDESTPVLSINEHQDLEARFSSMSPEEKNALPRLPMSAIQFPFRIKINGMDHVSSQTLPRLTPHITHLYVVSFLFHGSQILCNGTGQTPTAERSHSARWSHWISGEGKNTINIGQIPRASRIAFLLYGSKSEVTEEQQQQKKNHNKHDDGVEEDKDSVLLGYVVQNVVDDCGFMAAGDRTLSLWPLAKPKGAEEKKIAEKKESGFSFVFYATTRDNLTHRRDFSPAQIQVRFQEFARPVVAPIVERLVEPDMKQVGGVVGDSAIKKMSESLEDIRKADLFYKMDVQQKQLVWSCRHHLAAFPEALPKFLLSVDWTKKAHRMEAYRMMAQWAKPQGPAALELLGPHYADYRVREYAVKCLSNLPDDELQLYLLQFTQILKLEPYHDSPFARFLIKRALANPYQVGHYFFWSLKAELNHVNPEFSERYGVILEEYLSHGGPFTQSLRKQSNQITRLQRVAEHIAHLKVHAKYSKEQCMDNYVRELQKLNLTFFGKMGTCQIPLNPKLEAKDLIVDRCRFMSSKKVPLLLWFNNADEDADPISVIFKSGDDLRQDILTLQLLKVLDKIWLDAGLDFCMKPYIVMATGVNDEGEGVGMIETVTNSETVADIQWKYGGEQSSAAFADDTIDLYLRDHNKNTEYNDAVDRFTRSCAGYCVATYLLGIGDRHSDNYMVRNDGVFFHIDFGHFLGNWKYKLGVCRERTKFVFTPEMAHVMGKRKSPRFKHFEAICLEAITAARKHGRLLENLFALMVSAGMPELVIEEDIYYLRDRLDMAGKDATKCKQNFLKELDACLKDKVRRYDNMAHLMKHKS